MSEFINQLNEAQKKAVINFKGPSLVIAGAGSGKTRVLTYRIAYLLKNNVKPYRILALTFTNKAAREMKERIAFLIGEEHVKPLWMGTFHSVFAKFLRQEAASLGFPSSFTIYDAQDSKNIIKSIIKELKLDDKIYKPSSVYAKISSSKNNLITAEAYEKNAPARINDDKSKIPEFYRIFKIYTERCFRSGAMDFDDLLLKTNILFRDKPEILQKYQNKFDYILVDEYQDTNYSQYLIIKKLAEIHKNICVVGDDAQSIYSFRGAKIENILKFRNEYPQHQLYKLEQNYRSTKVIVDAANSVIEKNKDRIKKDVFSKNEDGQKIKLIGAVTDHEEGFIVVNKIAESILNEQIEYSDHAILYRTNAQSRIFEEALLKRNIPYIIYGGISFYQRKEIKDLLAYFKLLVNKKDDESFKRIINYPKRGIGDSTIERLVHFASTENISIWDAVSKIRSVDMGLNSRAVNQIFAFVNLINNFSANLFEKDAYALAKEIADKSGILKDLYEDKSVESLSRHENVQELLNGIRVYADSDETGEDRFLSNYLESVALLTDEDLHKDDERNKVTLMTIHSAKGLEFRNVYIVGVEERLFPSEMAALSIKEIEEERRLFYVALTRAEKEIYITFSGQRYRWGQLYDCTPSRFIKDINPDFIEFYSLFENSPQNISTNITAQPKKLFRGRKKTIETSGNNLHFENEKPLQTNYNKKLVKIQNTTTEFSADINDIEIGSKVYHARFGIGKIISLEGTMPDIKALINFDSSGQKNLLLKFAKLQVLK